jgi:uncharacterized membrane protein YvlD (DUF360 family)
MIVPEGSANLLFRDGFQRVEEVRAGDRTRVGDMTIQATEASHDGARYPFGPESATVGFVLHGEKSVYFAGDTDLFPEMSSIHEALDVALLPVWGGPDARVRHGPYRLPNRSPANWRTSFHPLGTFAPLGLGWLRPRFDAASMTADRERPRAGGRCARRPPRQFVFASVTDSVHMTPMGRRSSVYPLARRVAVLWAVEVAALWALARVVPGLSLEGWRAATVSVAVIGLANALVRPILLFLTLPFTVLSFGFLTLGLNALILWLAALVVPGLHVASFWAGFVTALGLAAVNLAAADLLAFHERTRSTGTSFGAWYNGRFRCRRTAPGLLFVEFDGLSAGTLERAMQTGYLPTLARWVATGSHRVVRWDCGVPSQTSSVQAGILLGNNFDIPAFRWFEKTTGKMVVSNDPADANRIEQRVSRGAGLLRDNGISVCNMFTGDARRSVATISTLSTPVHEVRETSSIYFTFFVNPYNFTRALAFMAWELVVERWESSRQSLRGVRPRVSRGGGFPLLRAASTIFQRDLGTYTLMSEMFAGVPIAYMTFVGYDVVAHHAGPDRADALRILRHLDRRAPCSSARAGPLRPSVRGALRTARRRAFRSASGTATRSSRWSGVW